jgi:hypothetical protein
MTNALMQEACQTPLSRDPITARYRAFGPLCVPKALSGFVERKIG